MVWRKTVVRGSGHLTRDTGGGDFWEGYETFLHGFVGARKCEETVSMGYETILSETTLHKVINPEERMHLIR